MNLHVISTSILVAHWLIVVGLFLRVIAKRAPVGPSSGWLALIASAPFVGAALYLLFGERRLGRRRAARVAACIGDVERWQAQLRELREASTVQLPPTTEPIRHQAEHVLGFPALTGNGVELFDDFQRVFDALIADIDGAATRCHLCFYIWHEAGRVLEVVEALVRAAERGVECRLLADAIGSKAFLVSASARRLRAAGVEVTPALPTGALRTIFVRRDLRNHRKIVVIDDRVAYTGSQNLVDPRYFKQDAGVGEWVDAMARISGPTATALDGVFALDWTVETGRACELPAIDATGSSAGSGSTLQVVPSGPDLRPEAMHQLLSSAIYAARSELVITTPYLVPDDAILTALKCAALRGVAVTLIVPEHNDSALVRYASVANYDELLTAGVTIALFAGGLLHTKSLTIDGEWSVFGSVNLDMRSIWLNFEISIFAYDAGFTGRLKKLQDEYLRASRTLDLAEWRRRPAARRFAENASRFVAPLL